MHFAIRKMYKRVRKIISSNYICRNCVHLSQYAYACIRKRLDHFLSFNSLHDHDTGFCSDFPRDTGIIIFSDNEGTPCLSFSPGTSDVSLSKQM